MPSKKVRNAAIVPPTPEEEGAGTEVALTTKPSVLIEKIDCGETSLLLTSQLVPFYVQADAIKKRIDGLMAKTKNALVERRDEGEETGDKNQHRFFKFDTALGSCELTVQERRSWKPNEEKLVKLLVEKKLYDVACDLRITTSGNEFQKFLRKHRAELRNMGVEIQEELNLEKVDGLCKANFITPEELEAILDKPDPTYALIPKLK